MKLYLVLQPTKVKFNFLFGLFILGDCAAMFVKFI